ncbi:MULTISPECIES: NAD(P)-binding protein [Francisella]|uniref:Protoporphyrinogen oxidase n=1 Tax=Francisella opportunistica TaxID=2016517 RepID=A0A345JQD8_9GAMM|nr:MULTISPECIES: NAD(P)-binding protein [Francisella]APC91236.1 Protoporphyrinogen IX oxidase, aerobic, HemY [Francisella sp. MA067296]AXH29534.1 protoporphyrinogen oxidase [Francisella opportunistica]AXH31185.1 protoporphyrinogen oxidase [Francisella opportunistica]AXH32832.1 protoporphyrinogen oxidase [Francisella opportunistica]
MAEIKYFNTIIIGAGISGISLAKRLTNATIENCIFEANKVGGCIDSISYNDFWFEMGAHTIYNSYADTIAYMCDNSLEQNIQPRKKLPFLFVQPNNKIQSIITNLNPFSLLFSFLKNSKITKQDKTVNEYAIKVFGKGNYTKTLKYCFDAVLSQNSKNFPMEYLFKKYDRDTTLPRSFTLKKGLAELFKKHNQNVIKETVISVTKQQKWHIHTSLAEYTCENLCFATPWDVTESLLEKILPNLAAHQYRPTMSKLISVGIVSSKTSLKHIKKLAGLIGKEQFFYSAVSRDVVDNPDYRAIVFHCLNDFSENELIDKVTKLLKITKEDILHIHIKNNTLPCYHRHHSQFLQDLDKELQKHPNLFISGNFFDRLAIENCIRRSNNQADKIIQNKTS